MWLNKINNLNYSKAYPELEYIITVLSSPQFNDISIIILITIIHSFTPIRDKFSMQIVLTTLTFPYIQAVPQAYSHKSNMQ